VKRLLLTLTLPLYALDQITKWLVLRHIHEDEVIPVVPGFFDLVQVHNTGAAFGMMTNNNAFFIGLSTIALIVMAVLMWRGMFREPAVKVGAALLLSGIFGNLTDRLLHGHVIDFLSFDLHVPYANPWPAFNVADSCICIAAAIFVASSLFEDRRAKQVGQPE
jgi:lipoprotein signal peptidase